MQSSPLGRPPGAVPRRLRRRLRCTLAVAGAERGASAVKSVPSVPRPTASAPGILAAGEELVRPRQVAGAQAGRCRLRSGRAASPAAGDPAEVAGTSAAAGLGERPRPSPRPGWRRRRRTRKNLTISGRSPSSTTTEVLDCSPREHRTCAGGDRQRSRSPRWLARGVPVGPVAACRRIRSSQAATKTGSCDAVVDPAVPSAAGRASSRRPDQGAAPRRPAARSRSSAAPGRVGARRRPSDTSRLTQQDLQRPPRPAGSSSRRPPTARSANSGPWPGTSAGAAASAEQFAGGGVRVGRVMSAFDGHDGHRLGQR